MNLNTYAEMRAFDIRNKLLLLNPELKLDDIDVVNVALVVFSFICDKHTNEDLERDLIVEEMLDSKIDFNHYVKDLIQQSNNTNDVLNEYIDKKLAMLRNEVK